MLSICYYTVIIINKWKEEQINESLGHADRKPFTVADIPRKDMEMSLHSNVTDSFWKVISKEKKDDIIITKIEDLFT